MKYKHAFLFFLGIISLTFLFAVSVRAQTEGPITAPRCFEINSVAGSNVYLEFITCPINDAIMLYHNAAGQESLRPSASTCYLLDFHKPGEAKFVFRQGVCRDLDLLSFTAKKNKCAATGGTWVGSETGGPWGYGGVASCQCQPPLGPYVKDKVHRTAECEPIPEAEDPTVGGELELDEDGAKIQAYVQNAVNLLTALAGLAITASFIVAGIQYSTSGGNPQSAMAAKKRIGDAFIAMLCLVFLYTFLQWLVPGGIFN